MVSLGDLNRDMEIKKAKERIAWLVETLNEHNRRYYQLNSPTISDYEFDLLLQELIHLEKLYPYLILENSPTKHVGSDLSQVDKSPFKQYPHLNPMLSLANTYNIEELRDFDARIRKLTSEHFTYNCELKFDGTGINLLYHNGILVKALTRGDGNYGDDVLRNVKTIKSIPVKLNESITPYPSEFEIRGEIYMPFEAFDRLNEEKNLNEEPLFANPRNAAAGSLKILDSTVVAKRGLECVLYHLIAPNLSVTEHSTALSLAASWGLPVSQYSKVCTNIDEVIEYLQMWDIKRKTLSFPTDGMVVKVNQLSLQKGLGYTAKTPRWAVAYKFKPEQALTKVESIDYQVGRSGAVTPVANLIPILLSGTTVKRATLHNSDQMELLDIHIGDYVYIEKGGEIIPKITSVELKKRDLSAQKAIFPHNCPVCGSELFRDNEQTKYFCPNSEACPPQIQGRFIHFCSRKALNINIGEVAIEQMYNKGYIHRLEDLYHLTDSQLLTLDKWKDKSVSNYFTSLNESKKVPFSRVLYGLGIRNIGETTAKSLASHFHNIDNLIKTDREKLIELEDVGPTLADSIISYFAEPKNIETIRNLKEAGLQMEEKENQEVSDELKGITIMITGTYTIPREMMKFYIEQHGGKVASSLSSSVTYLLKGDKPGESKIEKAKKLGIPIITEEEFYKIALREDSENSIEQSADNKEPKIQTNDNEINSEKSSDITDSKESEELTLF